MEGFSFVERSLAFPISARSRAYTSPAVLPHSSQGSRHPLRRARRELPRRLRAQGRQRLFAAKTRYEVEPSASLFRDSSSDRLDTRALACPILAGSSGSAFRGSRWREVLVVVKPETVVGWHRWAFRRFSPWSRSVHGSRQGRDPQTEACPNCTSTSIDAYLSRATNVTATPLAADGILAMDSP